MFKLSQIRDAQTAVMQVLDPGTGDPTGATITIMSPEHPKARAQSIEVERARRARASKLRGAPEDPEGDRTRLFERLVLMTVAWSGFADDDGVPIACTPEAVRTVYEDYAWIRDQVLSFVVDSRNFIVRSASSSSTTPAQPSA